MLVCLLQAQKAILDTELDIISKQNEGADTSTLRRKVSELKKEVTFTSLALLVCVTNSGHT